MMIANGVYLKNCNNNIVPHLKDFLRQSSAESGNSIKHRVWEYRVLKKTQLYTVTATLTRAVIS